MKIVVGTRGSQLALTQTNWIVNELKAKHPEVDFEVKVIKTKGDLVQNVPLDKIGDKGLFTKEIEEALLRGEIDLAVHSMKDMPSLLPEGLKFSYIPKREDPRDVLILREGLKTIDDLPKGAKVGTGSKRRKYQLLAYRSDLEIVPIRGNVDTRIRKLSEEHLDAIVLAAAGVRRLGRSLEIGYYLPMELVLPAPAQGILALEVRANDDKVDNLLRCLSDELTTVQAEAERSFMNTLEGSCHIPMGAYCEVMGDEMTLYGLFGDEQGEKLVKSSVTGKKNEAKVLGETLAMQIKKEFNEDGR